MTGRFLSVFFSILFSTLAFASSEGENPIRDLVIRVDTSSYSIQTDAIFVNNRLLVPFRYEREDEVVEVRFDLFNDSTIADIQLLPSGDFEIIDQLLKVNEQWKFKVRFKHLSKSEFVKFVFKVEDQQRSFVVEQEVYPYASTKLEFRPDDDVLFIGEEKVFEIFCNLSGNLRLPFSWVKGEELDYRLSERDGRLFLHVFPKKTGNVKIKVDLHTRKPMLNNEGVPDFDVPAIEHIFNVRSGRLRYLGFNLQEVILEERGVDGFEIQIESHPYLVIGKTYRIEKQADAGGKLVAELFTRRALNNDKILCWLRPYEYHRNSDGYLYVKDGDDAKFITNLNIMHKTRINKVHILREGSEWGQALTLGPGEVVEIKLEGVGLNKAVVTFEGLTDVSADSALRTEDFAFYRLRVPNDIKQKKVGVYINGEHSGFEFLLKEFQRPHVLDFVHVNYGRNTYPINSLSKPVFYDKTIPDVVISFDANKIDHKNRLSGKQILEVEIKVLNKRNELIEFKKIDDIVICPGESSPRHAFYLDRKCFNGDIILNNHLSNKTYDLEDWSRIIIVVRHVQSRYDTEGYSQKIEILQQRHVNFDIDVSFPAGLIEKRIGDQGYRSFGGISLAMIAQFSFYKPGKVNRLQPYKIGAGFLALNAFNFSDAIEQRDVGIVILGSIFPTSRDVKLTFPLFGGFGYLLKDEKFFFLIGPGIRVRL